MEAIKSLHILIVEDDYFIADELAKAVVSAGMDVVGPVSSTSEALAEADEQQIDAVVLDINLGGSESYEVADTFIKLEIPVVFVTGYVQSDVPLRFYNVPFCQKPVDLMEVIETLRRITGH